MKIFVCVIIAYLMGALNPAALISRLKHKSLRDKGTGNLGATNTMLVFGKKLGALVLLIDILKGLLAVWLSGYLVPEIGWLPMASGLAAVLGHCFPFYMKFKGGKGLATFAGVVLAYKPLLFLFLLVSGMALMFIVNYSFILPFYATVFFVTYVAMSGEGMVTFLLAFALCLLVVVMHFGNLVKAVKGEDRKIRDFFKSSAQKGEQKSDDR